MYTHTRAQKQQQQQKKKKKKLPQKLSVGFVNEKSHLLGF